ncbi:MAG: serine/threonine protein kinase with repeat [Bryobacterales bacterium]|nr:serine/threonine protein kinase with repeat [Bryobacterales bacterium]
MRAANSLLEKGVYDFDNFRLNTSERTLKSGGRPVSISPKALDVLILLFENRGRIIDKDELMRKVWPGTFVEENNLAFNVSVLRKMFAESGAPSRYIETVPKRGYRFVAEEVKAPESPALEAIGSRFRWPWKFIVPLFALALIGIFASRFRAANKLTDRDTIVLVNFVNGTGDPVFDGTLRQGLAVELEQSPFLSLITEARVKRTLRLMRQPGEALTPELAQELCQRTGSAVALEGSITSVGKQYVLGLRATNCSSGAILANEQVQVKRREDVLGALSQMARRFRLRVGESPEALGKHDVPLAEATTASLEALQAYTAAWKVHLSQGATYALPLFKRATELDPEFAMAHTSLGRIYADIDQADLAAESVRRAWQLRDRTSDREKFFITANYHLLATGNVEEVRKTVEAWARTYPRDAAPHTILSGYPNKFPGRFEDGAAEASKAIEIDPDFGIPYYNVAVNNAYLNRFAPAEGALQRAAARGLESDEFLMLAYDLAFLKNDPAEMERVAARARKRSGPQSWISNNQASVLAYSGRLQQARSMSRRAVAEAQQGGQEESAALWETSAAIREALFGNAPEARARANGALELFSKDPEVKYGAAFSLALAGDSSRSQELVDDLEKRFPDDTTMKFYYVPVLRARLALNHREPVKAVELLQRAVANELGAPRSLAHGYFGGLYPVWVRGEAYLALRRYPEAAAEFEKILGHRGIVISDPIGVLARLQHGRALALAGDKNKAKIAYLDFLTLWKDADPSLPALRQARTELAKLQ